MNIKGKRNDGSFCSTVDDIKELNEALEAYRTEHPQARYKLTVGLVNGKQITLQGEGLLKPIFNSGKISTGLNNCKPVLDKIQNFVFLIYKAQKEGLYNSEWFLKQYIALTGKRELETPKKEEKEIKETKPKMPNSREAILDHKRRFLTTNKIKTWNKAYGELERHWINSNKPIDMELIQESLQRYQGKARALGALSAIQSILSRYEVFHLDREIAKIKKQLEEIPTEQRDCYCPSDFEIKTYYDKIYRNMSPYGTRKAEHVTGFKIAYAILAIYGIRPHELYQIANWDSPVILKKNQWLSIDELDETSIGLEAYEGKIIPAICDPSIPSHKKQLAIGDNTKTGYRLVIPCFDLEDDWFEFFGLDLNQPLILPSYEKKIMRFEEKEELCHSRVVGDHFSRAKATGKIPFSAYGFRYAYCDRAYRIWEGIDIKTVAMSMGHKPLTNVTIYQAKKGNIAETFRKNMELIDKKHSEKEELKRLKEENAFLKEQVEKLKLELRLMQELHTR